MVVGALVSTLIASRPRLAGWGFALGVYNQWAWFYISIHDHSWGIVAMSVLYTINCIRGVCRHRSATWPTSFPAPAR